MGERRANMYNENTIENIKDYLKKELEAVNKEITGEVSHYQGFLLGEKNIIEFVLGVIDIGKED